jgi:hypothetical protein
MCKNGVEAVCRMRVREAAERMREKRRGNKIFDMNNGVVFPPWSVVVSLLCKMCSQPQDRSVIFYLPAASSSPSLSLISLMMIMLNDHCGSQRRYDPWNEMCYWINRLKPFIYITYKHSVRTSQETPRLHNNDTQVNAL